jgi:HlyD family secretion protein
MWQKIRHLDRRRLGAGAAVAVALVVGGFYLIGRDDAAQAAYRFARVEKGPLIAAVSASGTLNAVVTVQVGSQLSGLIKEIYADFNAEVKKDQVIAILDPQSFEAKVSQAQAELDVARATVLTQQASVERWRADVRNVRANFAAAQAQTVKSGALKDEAERDFARKTGLVQRGFISSADLDKSKSAFDSAAAQLNATVAQERAQEAQIGSTEAQQRMAEAQVVNAVATVKQRAAALEQAQIDLERTIIRAPLDGVIVLRNVDVGQTVAASLQAPTLFTIAQDLRIMEVHTTVDQADIGRIRVGQGATFTVDSYAGRTFTGEVAQIRIAPQTVQNVVTYVVVISAPNPDGRLLPGMTANVRIETAQRADVIKVPNAALRYRPPGISAALPGDAQGAGGGPRGEGGSPEQRAEQLARELGLSAEQKAQVAKIFTEARQQFQSMRRQGEGGGEQPAQAGSAQAGGASGNPALERQRMFAAVRDRVAAVLTPEQRQRYQDMQSQRANADRPSPGRVWVLGSDGKPKPVAVEIGIGDGNVSELVTGELKDGQPVIIGGGLAGAGGATAASNAQRPPGPPGFRL